MLQPKQISVCLKCLLVNLSSSDFRWESGTTIYTVQFYLLVFFLTFSVSRIYVPYVFVFHTRNDTLNSLNRKCNKPGDLWWLSDCSNPWQPSVKVTPSAFTLLPKHTSCGPVWALRCVHVRACLCVCVCTVAWFTLGFTVILILYVFLWLFCDSTSKENCCKSSVVCLFVYLYPCM